MKRRKTSCSISKKDAEPVSRKREWDQTEVKQIGSGRQGDSKMDLFQQRARVFSPNHAG